MSALSVANFVACVVACRGCVVSCIKSLDACVEDVAGRDEEAAKEEEAAEGEDSGGQGLGRGSHDQLHKPPVHQPVGSRLSRVKPSKVVTVSHDV